MAQNQSKSSAASGAKGAEEASNGGGGREDATKGANKNDAAPDGKDPIALIVADHRRVDTLFRDFEKATNAGEKSHLAEQICTELTVHTMLEEQIFYPACRDRMEDRLLDEAQVEHDGAKALIHEIMSGSPNDAYFDAKVKVLAENIRHHIREEEKPGDGLLAKAKAAGIATAELAQRLAARKQQLMADAESGMLGPPEMRSFRMQPRSGGKAPTSKENEMARGHTTTMERDERGRFMSDDDDRDYRRSSRYEDDDYRRRTPPRDEEGRFMSRDEYGGRSRSRYEDDDDDRRGGRRHGGWYGDPRGHAEAAREGWEERGDRSRGRSRYDDDDDDYRRGGRRPGGWYRDPRGHAEAAERGWDNPRHAPSGWFGEPEGHTEASRRGWDNPRRGRSGWFGDPEGHAEAAERGWDNPRHGRSGWYGDPEGHSEASRRGWEERGYTRTRSRYDDDDDDYRGRRRR